MSRRAVLAAGGAVALLGGCGLLASSPPAERVRGGFRLAGVAGVTRIAQLTGPGADNDTASVLLAGADLGHMTTLGERTFFVFGDNFGERDPEAYGGTGEIWKSNAMAWSTSDDPSDGIVFDGWILDELGQVKELLPGDHKPNEVEGETTKIPTQLFTVGQVMYLGYMSVLHWGAPGVWTADHAGLARSTDLGQTWEILPGVRWSGESNFVQLAQVPLTADGRDWIYLWGIPSGRFGSVKLMRVPASDDAVADPASYEYFAGTHSEAPRWSPREAEAVTVLDGPVGELSVMWSTHLERWLLTTMAGNADAVVFEGLSPWGPWSPPHTITTQTETPGLYAPYMTPRYVSDNGRRIYFTLSVWGPYQVFWYSMDLVGSATEGASASQNG
ncbi:MAG: DUF4185 domain-containing protein [Propionicimonas sp.]|nr:DUF4185 domain-containing protein [Propionicimonas sp.]